MAQNWYTLAGTTKASTAIKTQIADMLQALRTVHSGASAPSSTTPFMLWADTSAKVIKQLDAAGSTWSVVAPLGGNAGRFVAPVEVGALGTKDIDAITWPAPWVATHLVLMSPTTTADSSGNEHQFQLSNQTTAVDLFSGTVGTFTTLAGVGGGNINSHTAYVLTVDQNSAVAAWDDVQIVITAVGSPTAVSTCRGFVFGYEVGA